MTYMPHDGMKHGAIKVIYMTTLAPFLHPKLRRIHTTAGLADESHYGTSVRVERWVRPGVCAEVTEKEQYAECQFEWFVL